MNGRINFTAWFRINKRGFAVNYAVNKPSKQVSAIVSFAGLITSCLLISCSCEKSSPTEPPPEPPPKAELTLKLVDVGLTEAWLLFGISQVELPQVFSITRNGAAIITDTLTTNDTTVVDTGLMPATSYDYRVYRLVNGVKTDSASLQAATMDTTSHDFNWQIYTIDSPYGSGVLRDVAIINENDIWAVGEIYADSAQSWLPYNAVHWDGQQWELRRVTYGGSPWPVKSIFAFDSNDIWFDTAVKWNGVNFIEMPIPGIFIGHSINKMWGTSSNDLYAVGTQGLIAHYNGSSWQKIESGTQTTMQDIWGAQDPRTGEWEIICAASPGYGVADTGICKITVNHEVHPVPWVSGRAARSVWFDDPLFIYACGSGIFRKIRSGPWEEIGGVDVIPANTERLQGVASNDIFVVSDFGHIAHFNGKDFRVINPNPAILYESCDYKNNLMVAVGATSRNGFILKMWR